ncbi:MAG TPA: dihydrolipoamide acetyltransferase family protein, partial [Candidatus Deferrimicrobium sp.]|nr:dihydrolipoamide acetyltransferase family protein [Candidatus Deferrimicrobium sp.]
MATNVIMPALGVAQQTGTLLKWLKVEGESVTKGEPLMEIETDKATVEIEAPGSGILTQVIAKAGDQVPVGERIALILAPGEPLPPAPTAPARPKTVAKEAESKPATKSPSASVSAMVIGGRVLASPAAKRIAREKGVTLASLGGSGPEGSILAEDVLRAAPDETGATATFTADQILPLSPMRRIVGERMTHSKQSAPHFYISMDIDMSAVNKLRSKWKQSGEDQVPSLNDFILYACAHALKDFPSLNSSFTEQGIKLRSDINLGMAVALEEGLVVPVIRNADRLSLVALATQSRELVAKAQTKKLFPLDYESGTFTVSNLGMLGVDSFIAIINPPQCAILALGRVAPRVVADDAMFAIKSLMTATLSADHRVVDGA